MKLYVTHKLLERFPVLARLFHGYGTWVIFDVPIILGAFVLALLLRSITANLDFSAGLLFTLLVVAAFLYANKVMGIYRRYWSYAASHDVVALFAASSMATAAIMIVELFFVPHPLPFSVVIVGGFFAFVGQTAIRYRRRLFSGARGALRHSLLRLLADGIPTLIVGAGESGQALAFHMEMTPAGRAYHLVGFLDDDPEKIDKFIHGIPVLGRCDQVVEIVARRGVELIVIAIHNVAWTRLRALVDVCMRTDAQIRLLPDPLSSLHPSSSLPPLRAVTVQDLLGRPPRAIDREPVNALLRGRRVLVTGACGSIGAELVRQILQAGPERLVMLDNNESGLHDLVTDLRRELSVQGRRDPLAPVLGDVTLPAQVERIFARERPHLVFHAAAYKHVYWMERHPLQAIRVNVLGTHTVHQASHRHGADRFILISSDKAVDPASVMGATKRVCEMLVLHTHSPGQGTEHRSDYGLQDGAAGQRCAAVRFGNVLGSRGSVVPTFERQIDGGGPLTITDPRMRRFFMSVGEAVSLVLVATTLTEGADLFMLEMGEEVSIMDLANRMIRLRGLRPHTDIPIVFTGARPGEKLSEQLLGCGESCVPTPQPGIVRVRSEAPVDPKYLSACLAQFQKYVHEYHEPGAVRLLWSLVSPAQVPLADYWVNPQ